MDDGEFRELALGLPEAEEKSHFGKADFRVRDRIFATLPAADRAVVKLKPEEQQLLTEAEPAIFSPVKGGWGRKGWTEVALGRADDAAIRSALAMAWRNTAPAALVRARGANLFSANGIESAR